MGPGIERWPCAHKDPDMRVHGTTPRARSAVHTSLIRAGVKPLYAEPGQERGAQQRTNRVHRNWTGNLVACPTNLVPAPAASNTARRISSPPLPSIGPAHYSIRYSSVLSRECARSIGFKGPPSIHPGGDRKIRIGISRLGPFVPPSSLPLSCFRQEFVDKTMPASVSPPAIHGPLSFPPPSPSFLSQWLAAIRPICQFRSFDKGAPISIVRATVAAVRPVNKTVRQSCTLLDRN